MKIIDAISCSIVDYSTLLLTPSFKMSARKRIISTKQMGIVFKKKILHNEKMTN